MTRSRRVRSTLSVLFHALQNSFGVSVTPSHFYFPVPSLEKLREKDWTACRPLQGLELRLGEQLAWLRSCVLPYAPEWGFPETGNGDGRKFHFNNGFFERVDAEVAYSIVRSYRPRCIIEVGSGNTTRLLATALRRNFEEDGSAGELISIEPHPVSYLRDSQLTQLIERPVQQVPLNLFHTLHAGDILFIDSSHVVSIDNDVLHECLRILPELAPGVLVHFHDVFTPLDYPRKFVVNNLCFWGEQYLLEAFLSFNSAFRILWSASAMQKFHGDELQKTFPRWEGSFTRMPEEIQTFAPTLDERNVWPCSFWIVRN